MNCWRIKLSDIGKFFKGSGIARSDANSGDIPAVRYGELYTDYDTFIIEQTRSNISAQVAANSFELQCGDVLFAGSGETPKDIGKSAVFLLEKGYAGGDIIVLRPNLRVVEPKFIAYCFETELWKRQRRKMAQGQSIVHIHAADLMKIKINLPDLETQGKIVTILEKWDVAIENLKQQILEEGKLLTGLFQKIFSKKIRIADPLCKWEKTELGKVSVIKKGTQLGKLYMEEDGDFFVMNGGVGPSGRTGSSNMFANTITISEGGNSCGYVNYVKDEFWLGGHCYAIVNPHVDKRFLYFALKSHEKNIMSLRVGSGLPNIQKETLEKFRIDIPPKDEQEAIAKILDIQECKIDLLKQKLSNYESQRKYLLNRLLSGKKDI